MICIIDCDDTKIKGCILYAELLAFQVLAYNYFEGFELYALIVWITIIRNARSPVNADSKSSLAPLSLSAALSKSKHDLLLPHWPSSEDHKLSLRPRPFMTLLHFSPISEYPSYKVITDVNIRISFSVYSNMHAWIWILMSNCELKFGQFSHVEVGIILPNIEELT